MNQNPADELASAAENTRQKALEIAGATRDGALDAWSAAENYIQKNPWLTVAGALVAGIAVAALLPRRHPQPDRLHAVRDWLEDAYAKISDHLPDQDDIRTAAQSCPLSSAWGGLGKKLHIW